MSTYYLAIDIGASSGRHILAHIENGELCLEEIYRFDNGVKKDGDSLVWDIESLFSSVKSGIKKCGELGKIPSTVAIDTWGVDYVLLDKDKKEILPAIAYRDARTEKGEKEVSEFLPQSELYSRVGIQKMAFNTIYQLYCDRKSGKLDTAEHLLMIPDYLSFKLTGVLHQEYTNATTTALVNARNKTWDSELIEMLGLPKKLFTELSMPCTMVGGFTDEIKNEIGFDCTVIHCPSHDTASAVAACPIGDDSLYISSGTWSLIGTENKEPMLGNDAMEANFTNEGGIEYRFRFLKNIMGMWLFQNIRKEINKSLTYDEMMELAKKSDFNGTFDPSSASLLAPESMIEAIKKLLGRPELSLEDLLSSVYHSLALSYKKVTEEIENISQKKIDSIFIVGGGSKDAYLNQLTAEYTGKKVLTGLTEGTAIGNLLSQIMYEQKLSLAEARKIVKNTFEIKETN